MHIYHTIQLPFPSLADIVLLIYIPVPAKAYPRIPPPLAPVLSFPRFRASLARLTAFSMSLQYVHNHQGSRFDDPSLDPSAPIHPETRT
jgi:hypothetical protein